jgi:hypothetical protein
LRSRADDLAKGLVGHVRAAADGNAERQVFRDLGIDHFVCERPEVENAGQMAFALLRHLCSGPITHWESARAVICPILHWLTDSGRPLPQAHLPDLRRMLGERDADWGRIEQWFADNYR